MKIAILKHPAAILTGVAIGAAIGLSNPGLSAFFGIENFAQIIALPGELYLFFLQMTVLPIIVTAISSSLGKLMRSPGSASLIKKFVAVFAVCVVVCAAAGVVTGMLGKPGSGLGEEAQAMLAKLLPSEYLEVALGSGGADAGANRPGMISFFKSMVSANIFQSLAMGSVMAILFFSVIFGIAIGFLPDDSAALLINLCTAIFQAFQKFIGWSLYLLPFGLISLLAGQIAAMGIQIFTAMFKFIILYCASAAVIFILGAVIIWIRSGIRNPFKVMSVLSEPTLLAFVTRSSMATLPSAISCLEEKMNFSPTTVNLTLPLGITLGRFGFILHFAIGVFFVGQIYGISFEPVHYLIIFAGVIFAGTATVGAAGIVALSMFGIVLEPLNLPMEAILVMFIAIDPIIDPFLTVLNVHVNMAATTLVAKRWK